jgi:hypothetical protein
MSPGNQAEAIVRKGGPESKTIVIQTFGLGTSRNAYQVQPGS